MKQMIALWSMVMVHGLMVAGLGLAPILCEILGSRDRRPAPGTLAAANNYANTLLELKRFEEAKALTRKTIPVARRVLGEGDTITLRTRWNYARALYEDPAATLDDLHEAVTTLEEVERTARRVLGGAHPLAVGIEETLQTARATLRRRT